MRIASIGLAVVLALPASMLAAQQSNPAAGQPDPLVEAARRAKEQKKDQPKAAKVWDNDNIPTKPTAVNVVGEAPATSEEPSPALTTATQTTAPATPPMSRAQIQAQVQAEREKLLSLKTDLDILQRTYDLDSKMYYGKPNYAADKEGAAKLAGEKSQIDAKQQEIADLEKKIQELEGKS